MHVVVNFTKLKCVLLFTNRFNWEFSTDLSLSLEKLYKTNDPLQEIKCEWKMVMEREPIDEKSHINQLQYMDIICILIGINKKNWWDSWWI